MRSWLVEIVSEDWEDCTKFQHGSVTLMCVVCGVCCVVVGREMLTRSLHLNNWYLQSPHHTGHTTLTATADSAARHRRQTGLSPAPETTKATDWTVRTGLDSAGLISLGLSSQSQLGGSLFVILGQKDQTFQRKCLLYRYSHEINGFKLKIWLAWMVWQIILIRERILGVQGVLRYSRVLWAISSQSAFWNNRQILAN